MRILIAEDDDALRESLIRLCEVYGHEVTAVTDGAALLDALEKGARPDLVISDNNMPNLTGLQALNRLRADDQWATLPIIICSGINDIADQVRALGAIFIEKSGSDVFKEIERISRALGDKDSAT